MHHTHSLHTSPHPQLAQASMGEHACELSDKSALAYESSLARFAHDIEFTDIMQTQIQNSIENIGNGGLRLYKRLLIL